MKYIALNTDAINILNTDLRSIFIKKCMTRQFFNLLKHLKNMSSDQKTTTVPGWVGGFAQSNPKFAYPDPDLNSLPMLGNMDNIGLLTRQQPVKWPEFSWNTEPGQPDPRRCFQMFAPYISRLGYNNKGRGILLSVLNRECGSQIKYVSM